MNEEQKEKALLAIEGAANFLRGASFDMRIPQNSRDAFVAKADELDRIAEELGDEG